MSESRRAVGQLERGVAEIDRDPPPLLLGQPVRVLARQRPHEPRLAVVDVPGGADRQRHEPSRHCGSEPLERSSPQPPERLLARARGVCHQTASARGARGAATSSISPSASARTSSSSRPSRTIPTTGGSPARSGSNNASSTAQAKLGSSASGSAPPPTRATVSSTSPPTQPGEPLGPLPHRGDRLGEHAQHRDLAAGALGVEGESERALERRERQLVGAQRALQRMPPQPLDQVGAAGEDPGLRPAEQLVAREADEVGAGGEARRRGRLVADRRRARPSRDRRRAAALRCCASSASSAELGLLGEADDAEVGLVHAQDDGRLGADRPLVVRDPGAVRGPDLDEPRARAGEHVGNPEAVADLDQLAARDEHLAALGERGQGEQHGRGVVVDDERRLGARDPAQQRRRDDPGASPALPRRGRTRGSSSRRRPRRRGRARPARAARGRDWCGSAPRSR